MQGPASEANVSTPVVPETPRVVILANRYAGALSRLGGKSRLRESARAAGLEPEIIYTHNSRHLRQVLRREIIGKVDRVVVAGGDGTLHEAVQELAYSGVALGILPQGTANNFATGLGIPRDLTGALRVVAENQIREIDLGKANEIFFTEGAGAGIFAHLLAISDCGRTKNQWNVLQALLHLLLENRSYRLTVVVDGVPYTQDVLNVTVANSAMMAMNLEMAPQADLTDSTLDVVLIRSLQRSEWLSYYRAVRSGRHLKLPKVESFRAKESIQILAPRPLSVYVDDRVRHQTPVTLNIAAKALRVFVPG